MSARRPLFVAHNASPGGSNEVVRSILRHRPPGSEPACVFLEEGPMVAVVSELGVPVTVVPAGRSRHLWRTPGVVRALRQAMKGRSTDLVFAHVPKAHAYASVAARLERLPYLWWQHDPPQLRPLVKRVAALLPADAVVYSSDFTRTWQDRFLGSAPGVTIHCGTETDPLPDCHLHTTGSEALVGTVGRIQRYKRYELFLRAASPVRAEAPGTRFAVIGGTTPGVDPGYEAELGPVASELGLSDAVEFAGHVDDAPSRIGELDVLVHTAELEPFGLVVIEAMLRGVPVVAPSSGGPAEIVRSGVDGILVDPEDTRALAAAILRLVRDPGLRAEMGAAGRERVLSEFSAQVMAQQTWDLMGCVAAGEPVVKGTTAPSDDGSP